MKKAVVFIIFIVVGCHSVTKEENKILNQEPIKRKVIRNNIDTFCFENPNKFNTKDFKLLRACDIIYNDSITKDLTIKWTSQKLAKEYNMEIIDIPMTYTIRDDSVFVNYMFINPPDNKHIPKLIKQVNDTLYLKIEVNGKLSTDFSSIIHVYSWSFILSNKTIKPVVILNY